QRLDLLALRKQRQGMADRRAAPGNPRPDARLGYRNPNAVHKGAPFSKHAFLDYSKTPKQKQAGPQTRLFYFSAHGSRLILLDLHRRKGLRQIAIEENINPRQLAAQADDGFDA